MGWKNKSISICNIFFSLFTSMHYLCWHAIWYMCVMYYYGIFTAHQHNDYYDYLDVNVALFLLCNAKWNFFLSCFDVAITCFVIECTVKLFWFYMSCDVKGFMVHWGRLYYEKNHVLDPVLPDNKNIWCQIDFSLFHIRSGLRLRWLTTESVHGQNEREHST